MAILRALCLCLFALCTLAGSAQGESAITGRWRLTASGAEISITPATGSAGRYDITLLNAEDMSLPTGIVIGEVQTTPTPGRFAARIAANPNRPKGKRRSMVITLKPNGSLSFEPYRSGTRVSLWRWIPYLFRVTVLQPGRQPSDIEGAVRADKPDLTRHRVL